MVQEIAQKIDNKAEISDWTNWKWQLRHSIKTLEQFENLTGIKFESKETEQLQQTFEKFPLSITPYYLSLIRRKDYRHDPVFKQSFGSPEELITLKSECTRPPVGRKRQSR